VPDETQAVVPKLRGLLHAGTFPAAAVAGAVLIAHAQTPSARLACAIYAVACAALFGVSAVYHRSPPGSRRKSVLARLDHVNILLVIAGTYTPLAVLALHGPTRVAILAVIWTVTAGGCLLRLAWRTSWRPLPGWICAVMFGGLGWIAVFILPQMWRGTGSLALVLVLAGGLMYTLGAVVWALKRPDPSQRWFGYHEVFHVFTILAYVTQYCAVSLLVYRAALSADGWVTATIDELADRPAQNLLLAERASRVVTEAHGGPDLAEPATFRCRIELPRSQLSYVRHITALSPRQLPRRVDLRGAAEQSVELCSRVASYPVIQPAGRLSGEQQGPDRTFAPAKLADGWSRNRESPYPTARIPAPRPSRTSLRVADRPQDSASPRRTGPSQAG
jgi:hemolysin III